ncbi:ParB/RepB/Spo0J family partition protein [Yinghuangia sp. YIM S10712]|uniref:ParB/RepB/Spo0J family partition protein n=1 Tax=Yinghuangia sp. YIM S10712 TaxID=3436930 RepID=UPI003F5315F7
MLPEDELAELADDIAEHGLLFPIVLDPDGVLLDGRNRLAACDRAGVQPTFTTYEGPNPAAYILGANINRRHVTQGQRAMIAAIARSGTRHSLRATANAAQLSRSRVTDADFVLRYASDLADHVRTGAISLDEALATARRRKTAITDHQARFASLEASAPDLARRIREEEMTLADAETAARQRRKEAADREAVHRVDATRADDGDTGTPFADLAQDGDITWTEALIRAEEYLTFRDQQIRRDLEQIHASWHAVTALQAHPDSDLTHQVLADMHPAARALARYLLTVAPPTEANAANPEAA